MRVAGTIPHPKLAITVFIMNEKYIVKFEAGGMEQSVKFTLQEVDSVESIAKMLDQQFMNGIIERFNALFLELKRIKDKV